MSERPILYLVRRHRSGEVFNIFASREGAEDWIFTHGGLTKYYVDKWDLKP